MSRALVVLALATGIAPSVWADEDGAAVVTAFELLAERAKAAARAGGSGSTSG